MNSQPQRAPTMADLDEIARARLHAERLAPALRDGQRVLITRRQLDTMYAWPKDATGCGFRLVNGRWTYAGREVAA